MSSIRVFITFFITLFPLAANAEVMDKEFSLITILLLGLVSSFLVFFASRLKPLWLLVLLPVVSMFFYIHLAELIDPHIGPAIAKEAGIFYIALSWTAPVLVIISGTIGFALRPRKAKPEPSQKLKQGV